MKTKTYRINGTDAYGRHQTETVSIAIYNPWERFARWFMRVVLRRGRIKTVSGIVVSRGSYSVVDVDLPSDST